MTAALNGHQQLVMEIMGEVPQRPLWPTMLLVWEFEKRGWNRHHLHYALKTLCGLGLVEHAGYGAWAVAR